MTKPQLIFLMASGKGLWARACRAQGWNEDDRDLRLNVLSEALRRPIAGSGEINAHEDFDAVKAHLTMLAHSLKGALESNDPNLGRARRLRNKIIDLVRCLNLYADGEAIAREIIKDGTHRAGMEAQPYHDLPLPRILESLTASPEYRRDRRTGQMRTHRSQLDQIVMTLSARLNGKHGYRAQAGDTLHDMNVAAGLQCNCKECSEGRKHPTSNAQLPTSKEEQETRSETPCAEEVEAELHHAESGRPF